MSILMVKVELIKIKFHINGPVWEKYIRKIITFYFCLCVQETKFYIKITAWLKRVARLKYRSLHGEKNWLFYIFFNQ